MHALFPPWTDAAFRAGLALAATSLVGAPASMMVWARSPYATGQYVARDQPLQFDHRHHTRDDGIGCLYCHGDAARSRYAGVPSTSLCMGCHAQVWSDSPLVAALWRSEETGAPIPWARVHALPGHVYFDHAAHVRRGVGCVTCHGRVDRMAQVYPVAPLSMRWCLDCHRDPDPNLRPLDRVDDMTWRPSREAGRALRLAMRVDPPTHCSGCHR